MCIAFHRLALDLVVAPALLVSVALGQSLPSASPAAGAQQNSKAAISPAQAPPAPAKKKQTQKSALPVSPAEQIREERTQLARDLLELSYSIGATIPPNERVKVLPRQITAANFIDPRLASQWAEEALAFAQELTPGDDRDSVYASAIPVLARRDPEHALEVFRTVPAEAATSPAFNFALQGLFATLVREQGSEGMDLVRQEALRLSQASYYPYSAVLNASRELHSSDAQLRQALFYESASAYNQGTDSPESDAEFARMLQREGPRVPLPAAQLAYHSLVDKLLARAEREDQQASALSSSDSSSSSSPSASPARDSADSLLRRLLPVLQRIDPELRQQVLEERPSVAASSVVGNGVSRAGLFFPSGGFGPSPSRPQQARMGDQQQEFMQYSQARRNPAGALTASTAISDPLPRALALVGAAAGLARKDPAGASTALQQALDAAGQITDPGQQLQVAVTMTMVTAQMKDSAALRTILQRGFQAADTLQQSDDEAASSRAQSTLQRLARSGFQQDPALTLSFVNQERVPVTQAELLIEGAEAIVRGRGRGESGYRFGGAPQRQEPASPAPNPSPPAQTSSAQLLPRKPGRPKNRAPSSARSLGP